MRLGTDFNRILSRTVLLCSYLRIFFDFSYSDQIKLQLCFNEHTINQYLSSCLSLISLWESTFCADRSPHHNSHLQPKFLFYILQNNDNANDNETYKHCSYFTRSNSIATSAILKLCCTLQSSSSKVVFNFAKSRTYHFNFVFRCQFKVWSLWVIQYCYAINSKEVKKKDLFLHFPSRSTIPLSRILDAKNTKKKTINKHKLLKFHSITASWRRMWPGISGTNADNENLFFYY